ncbi:hypothetical protein DVI44_003916 [Escherichia coli]|uniref:Uncharacterized protein n=1 Tax=Escherichia coli O145 TaxID=1055538 RepID=A0A9Q6Y0U4_ECOLX|nr:hypothetical protein [Escherichia coli]EEC7222777.1 hypothetical protein [Escherichia coli O145]EEQ2463356.1 hypothetical protein [Escherichia coli O157:H7]EES0771753.1 hypothetical protein [Escherichia coli O157]EET3377525.1 hypothetical protein [Escherichia coli O111]EEV1191629.1 hypothetical protein [Escherichia coli O157:NM]EFA8824542.1 hypothetical protein [Escherichia coli O55:H7]QKA69904.1 hypothetical protein E4U83_16645 [Escherichia coli O157:H7 str. F8092B]
MNQKDSRHVLLPLSNSLKSTGKRAHCRYGNELNQTDSIAHQPDSGYHPRAYVWDHIHIRRSGLSVQKGGSISGPLFLCLKNPNFVVFQSHQGERIPAHVLAYIQSSWL